MANAQQSSYLRQLHEAHKARQARIALAAMKAKETTKPQAKIIDVTPGARERAEMTRLYEKAKERARAWEEEKKVTAKEKWRMSWRYMILLASGKKGDFGQITLREIMEQTAKKYSVSVHDMKSARRTRGALMQARFEFCWRAKNETYCSFPQIGRALNKDHTSIIHAVKHYERMRQEAMGGPAAYKPQSGKFVLHDLIIKDSANG